jgi:hypothetical protein
LVLLLPPQLQNYLHAEYTQQKLITLLAQPLPIKAVKKRPFALFPQTKPPTPGRYLGSGRALGFWDGPRISSAATPEHLCSPHSTFVASAEWADWQYGIRTTAVLRMFYS